VRQHGPGEATLQPQSNSLADPSIFNAEAQGRGEPQRNHESTKDTKARKTAFHTKTRQHETSQTIYADSEEADFRVPS
jgi:hypothetical protein